MTILIMTDLDLKGKRLLIRQDLNVPIKDGKVANDKRIRASLPTLQKAIDAGARVMVMSHLGRPKEGEYAQEFSLAPVARRLSELLDQPVKLVKDWLDGVEVKKGQVVLCENVRFLKGEKKNDEELGRKMAALCDVYVMDAFGTAHRSHASTHAVAKFAKVACAGPLLSSELAALEKVFKDPARPLLAIVGGSKVSSKLTVLNTLSEKVDCLIVGGGIANNFLAAAGYNVGKSLYEPDLVDEARKLIEKAKAAGGEIPIPTDVVVASELTENAIPVIKPVSQVTDQEMILDIGPETAKTYSELVKKAGTVVWNGPVGVFEYEQFAGGTKVLGNAIAHSKAFSIAGGGETMNALEQFGIADKLSYISTGGGAFLEFLEGKTLPAVGMLDKRG